MVDAKTILKDTLYGPFTLGKRTRAAGGITKVFDVVKNNSFWWLLHVGAVALLAYILTGSLGGSILLAVIELGIVFGLGYWVQ